MNTTNSSIHWTDDFLLGFGPMDETHQEFVTGIAAIQNAAPQDCLVLMDQLLEQATILEKSGYGAYLKSLVK